MPFSSICHNCGHTKSVQNYSDVYCPECTVVKTEAEKTAPEGTSDSDRIRLGKTALLHRSTHAFKGWKNPRDFNNMMRNGS